MTFLFWVQVSAVSIIWIRFASCDIVKKFVGVVSFIPILNYNLSFALIIL